MEYGTVHTLTEFEDATQLVDAADTLENRIVIKNYPVYFRAFFQFNRIKVKKGGCKLLDFSP